ncbi:hypothetical protein D3P09_11870 [Paenibacillus pinisoli]|uniref:Uncharacterized protein n=1 Tax=Paenibacillus pinisoli TaxID=1276110 RepID=A0A3A6PGK5_9BACL|nr:replicative helicase loader/inhibitor [Paenibacillus pinisoli]RJX40065.1 hypothetical protein D3P09_11870 [Paenibacillus pinisoli]
MNKLQLIDLFGIIKRTYPSFDISQPSIEHYAKYLQDFPYETACANMEKYMLTERFPPTIADIRGRAGDLKDSERSKAVAAEHMAKLDAWGTGSHPPSGYWKQVMNNLRGGTGD